MIALTILQAAVAATPVFAPPLDRPIRVLIAETRDYGGEATRYATERVVVFRHRDDGYRAEVETLPTHGDAGANGNASAEAGLNALVGQRVLIDLDASGNPVSVADDETLWARIVDGIGQDIGRQKHTADQAKSAAAILGQLRAFPPDRRAAMIGGIVSPLIGLEIVTAGVRDAYPVTTTLRSPDGVTIELAGTERRYRAADGAIVLERNLSGASGERRVTVALTRRADPATGVQRASRRQTDWWVPGGHLRQVSTTDIGGD